MTGLGQADGQTARRWRAWLDSCGPRLATGRPVVAHDLVTAGDGPAQVFAWQVFVRANAEERRSLDLLLVASIERAHEDGEPDHPSPAFVVVGPEALRARTSASPAGLTIDELTLGPVEGGLRSVSVAVVRVPRANRSRDVLASLEPFERLLSGAEPDVSGAVANALLRRMEVLTSGPGVRVSVAGALRRPPAMETLHLLADAPLALDDDLELRDGRLVVVTGARSPTVPLPGGEPVPPLPSRDPAARDRRPWAGDDYVLLRVGRPATRQAGEARPLAQRRMEHALAEVGPDADAAEPSGSYSERVAAVRQGTHAQRVVRAALSGDTAAAVRRLSSALTEPGADGPLVDGLADEIQTVPDFWLVLPLLREAGPDLDSGSAAARAVIRLEERLGRKLDQLLALDGPQNPESAIPIVTPNVLEISDPLVPIVDSRLDGGHFLYELVPAMRDRIRDRTGVVVPGVRARGAPGLAGGQFVIQIGELPVLRARTRVDGRYAVRSVADEPVPATADITDLHPLTGEPGRWQIDEVEERAGDDATFSSAQYMVHCLEREISRSLRSALGLQEVDTLLRQWRTDDAALVGRVIEGPVAAQRLTVLLQELVHEHVPVGHWRTLLTAVADAGGMDVHLRDLQLAARRALRGWLPGLRSGPTVLRLPDSIASALGHRDDQGGTSVIPSDGYQALTDWLQRWIDTLGPVLTVITDDPEVRRRVAVVARWERLSLLTLTAEESG